MATHEEIIAAGWRRCGRTEDGKLAFNCSECREVRRCTPPVLIAECGNCGTAFWIDSNPEAEPEGEI